MGEADSARKYVSSLIKRAMIAWESIEFASQEQVDSLCTRIAWGGCKPEFARRLATLAVEESGMGTIEDKYAKIATKVRGTLYDMLGEHSVGVVERDEKRGLVKYAKPVGVIGALVPCTNPEATPFVKALSALKSRNPIILSPHPRTLNTNRMAVAQIRASLKEEGFPEDLVQGVEMVSGEISRALMQKCYLVIATGGGAMVKEAYRSGTPAYGVGAGNAVTIVDETADIEDAADKIRRSKVFDNATSCSSENSILIRDSIYQEMVAALKSEGGYLVDAAEKKRLQGVMWKDGALSREVIARDARSIASLAGISIGADIRFLMVEETGMGTDFPFSGEKLSPVVTLYRWGEFDEAVEMVNTITDYSGAGHSCGIHSTDEARIAELGERVSVCRIMVRQPQCLANSGAWTNGMPMSMTLGCGSWGGNISSDNITWRNLLNYTTVSYETPSHQPTDRELFGSLVDG